MPRFTSSQITSILVALIGALAAIIVPIYVHYKSLPTTVDESVLKGLEREKTISQNLVIAFREKRYLDVCEDFSAVTKVALPVSSIQSSSDTVLVRLGQPLSNSEPMVIQNPQGDLVVITQRFTKGNLVIQTVFNQERTKIMQLWMQPYYR
ncbi:hypothetical protein [Hymenobacter algoricola]|uniref:Type II secretion system protein n=1 Tax=Hymenobacter algoricola TaxID=486267 RepID=A0ABP7NSG5_9BACT